MINEIRRDKIYLFEGKKYKAINVKTTRLALCDIRFRDHEIKETFNVTLETTNPIKLFRFKKEFEVNYFMRNATEVEND